MKLYQTAPVTTVDPVDVVPLSSVAAALRMQLLGRGVNGCQWHQGSVVSLSAPPKIGWGTRRIEGRYYDRDEDVERTPKMTFRYIRYIQQFAAVICSSLADQKVSDSQGPGTANLGKRLLKSPSRHCRLVH